MAGQRKVIITCAVTGAIHTPSMSPHLPITPDEIAEAAIGAAKAGAAVVHLHARMPEDGRPTQDPAMFKRFLPKIKAASDVVINITTGGAPTMAIEERLQPALQLKPEVASLNMGSMNFGLYEMIPRVQGMEVRVGEALPRRQRRAHLQEHLQGHRLHPAVLQRERHALRDRVLRHRAPVHRCALPRSRAGQAAAVHPVGVRHPRRHRPASGGRAAHEAHRRPPVRRSVPVVGAGRRAQPDVHRHAVGGDGRQRARRAGGQPVDRQGSAREEQCRSGEPRSAASSRNWDSRSPRRTTRGRS